MRDSQTIVEERQTYELAVIIEKIESIFAWESRDGRDSLIDVLRQAIANRDRDLVE